MSSQYQQDCAYGHQNEINVVPYVEKYLQKLLNDETITIEKYKNRRSIFDFYVPNHNILLEIKSRRNSVETYPTQLIGMNKVNWGRTRKKNNKTRLFYFWVLVNPVRVNRRDIFCYEDTGEKEFETKLIYDPRYKKYSKCGIIYNKETEFISSFEV